MCEPPDKLVHQLRRKTSPNDSADSMRRTSCCFSFVNYDIPEMSKVWAIEKSKRSIDFRRSTGCFPATFCTSRQTKRVNSHRVRTGNGDRLLCVKLDMPGHRERRSTVRKYVLTYTEIKFSTAPYGPFTSKRASRQADRRFVAGIQAPKG
jgi:hypothetical protein